MPSQNDFTGETRTAIATETIAAGLAVDYAGTTAKEALKASVADSGDTAVGIAMAGASAAGAVPICINGIGRAVVDGSGTAIAAGDFLAPSADSSGKLTKATDGHAIARACEPSSAAGDEIRVDIFPIYLGASE